MQADGNFVLYDRVGRAVLWATHTNGKGSPKYVLAMQADNNLVLYANSVVTWAKGKTPMGTLMGVSFGPQAPFKLVMQDDGNLVMYDVRGLPFWETATNPGR
jgi:hypothetical protein